MTVMTPQDYYADFMAIRGMRSPTPKRVRMLTELLGGYKDNWIVTGVTKEALKVFEQHNFRKASRMGINRSHLVDRHKTYTHMIEGPEMTAEEWWQFYRDNDKTVLATSSENMTNNFSHAYTVDTELGLFRTRGFAWTHNKAEAKFLEEMYNAFLLIE